MCKKSEILVEMSDRYVSSKRPGMSIIDGVLKSVRKFVYDSRLKISDNLSVVVKYRPDGRFVFEATNSRGDYTQVVFTTTSSVDDIKFNVVQNIGGRNSCRLNISYEDCIRSTSKCLRAMDTVI